MIEGITPQVARTLGDTLAAGLQENAGAAGGASFKNVFSDLIAQVDQAQKSADHSIQNLVAGDGSTSIQDVVLKLEEADVAFRLMKEIRDKLLSAYKEIASLQV